MPIPKTQVRLPKVLSRDQVYQQLRLWIVGGVLKPGERLNFHEIGRQLGFSVIPIREACMRLHYEGFVHMAHSRWTRVVSLDDIQAIEVCEAIKALEVSALVGKNGFVPRETCSGARSISRQQRKLDHG